jgi:hypothetical protein
MGVSLTNLPSMEIAFLIPITTRNILFRRFDDFSLSLIEAIVEKFNKDFLTEPEYRRMYRKIMKDEDAYIRAPCIRSPLLSKQQAQAVVEEDTNRACNDCFASGQLCARIRTVGNEATLLIYPLLDQAPRNEEWRSLAFWVNE